MTQRAWNGMGDKKIRSFHFNRRHWGMGCKEKSQCSFSHSGREKLSPSPPPKKDVKLRKRKLEEKTLPSQSRRSVTIRICLWVQTDKKQMLIKTLKNKCCKMSSVAEESERKKGSRYWTRMKRQTLCRIVKEVSKALSEGGRPLERACKMQFPPPRRNQAEKEEEASLRARRGRRRAFPARAHSPAEPAAAGHRAGSPPPHSSQHRLAPKSSTAILLTAPRRQDGGGAKCARGGRREGERQATRRAQEGHPSATRWWTKARGVCVKL